MATAGLPLWSTTAAGNATADPAVNWAEGMSPAAVNDSARAMMASAAKWRDDLYGITAGLSTGGTSTAYTVTTNSTYASASVMSGAIFSIIPHATSGASPTLAVDGLTARALNFSTGVAIPTGALIASTPYFVRYVHASTEFIVIGPSIRPLTGTDIIGGTSLTSIAVDDTLPIYDLSATANRRMLVSDFLKVVNLLTADATPDKAADYVMTYDASATAAKKVLLRDLPSIMPRGYIDGCVISNNGSDATNDIDIAAGVCRDSTNTVDITVAAMTGKQLDANWVAGAGAGMRNSGAGIANGTYHIYAVSKADGTQDIYAHTSATVATVITALQAESGGSGYLYARRIGSILRESAAIVGFVQYGDRFHRKTMVADVAAVGPGTSAVTRTLSVPTGIVVGADVIFNVQNSDGASATYALLTDLALTDTTPSVTLTQLPTIASSATNVSMASTQLIVQTNTSGQVRSRVSFGTAAVSIYINTRGWVDLRGKDS